MGPQAEFLETVLTCKGNFYAPDFSSRFDDLKCRLQKLVIPDNEKNFEVKKVEPWNSVRVTLKLPADAAYKLKHLAEQRDGILREMGVLAVQIEGDSAISLTMDSTSHSNTNVLNDNIICSSSNTCPVKNVPSNDISKSLSSNVIFDGMPNSMSMLNQISLTGTKLNDCFQQQANNVHKSQTNLSCTTFNALENDCKAVTPNIGYINDKVSPKNIHPTMPVSSQHLLSSSTSSNLGISSSTQPINLHDDSLIGSQNISSSSPLLVNLLKSPGNRTNFNSSSSQVSTQIICEAMELSSLSTQKRKRNQTRKSKRFKESSDLNYLYSDIAVNCTKASSFGLSSSQSSSSSSSLSTTQQNESFGTWNQTAVTNDHEFSSMNATNFSSDYQQKLNNISSEHLDKCKVPSSYNNLMTNVSTKAGTSIANVNSSHSYSLCHNKNHVSFLSTSSASSVAVDSSQMKHIVSSQTSPSVSHLQMSKYSNSSNPKIMNSYDQKNSLNNVMKTSTSSNLSNNFVQTPSTSSSFSSSTSLITQTYIQNFLNHISIDSQSNLLSTENLLNTNSSLLSYVTSVHSDRHVVPSTASTPSSTSLSLQPSQPYINASLVNYKPGLTLQNSLPNSLKNMNAQIDQKVNLNDTFGENGRIQFHNLIRPTLNDQPTELTIKTWPTSNSSHFASENKEELTNVSSTSLPVKFLTTNVTNSISNDALCNQINHLLSLNPNYTQILKDIMPKLSGSLVNWSPTIINSSPINGHQLHLSNSTVATNSLKHYALTTNFLSSKNFIKLSEDHFVNPTNSNYNNISNVNNCHSGFNSFAENSASDSTVKHGTSPSEISQFSSDVKFVFQSTTSTSVTYNETETSLQASNSNNSSKCPPMKKPCKSTEDSLPQRSKANLTVAQLLEQVEIAKHNQLSLPTSASLKSDVSIDACISTTNSNPSIVQHFCADDNNDLKLQKPIQMTVAPAMPYSDRCYPTKPNYNSLTRASLDPLPMPITSPGYPHNLTESVQRVMGGLDFHNSPPCSPLSSSVKFKPTSTLQSTLQVKTWSVDVQASVELPIHKVLSTYSPPNFSNSLSEDILSSHAKYNSYEINSKEVNDCEKVPNVLELDNDNRNLLGGVDASDFDFVFNVEDENHLDSIIASRDYDDIERLAGTFASNIDDCDIDEAMLIGEDDSESLEQQAHLKDVSDLIKNDYLTINSVKTSEQCLNTVCLPIAEDSNGNANGPEHQNLLTSRNENTSEESGKTLEENGTENKHDINNLGNFNLSNNKKIKRKAVASKKDNSNNMIAHENKSESLVDDINNSNVTRMSTRSSNKAKCMPACSSTTTNCLSNSIEPLVVLTPTTNISLKEIKNDNSTISSTTTSTRNIIQTPRRSGRTIKKTELALELTPSKCSDKPRRTSLREHYISKESHADQSKPSNTTKIQIISLSIKQDNQGKLPKNKSTPTLRRHKSNNLSQTLVLRETDESNDDIQVDKKDMIENDRNCLSDDTLELSISSGMLFIICCIFP
ncbi:hypothetical protein HELRODRAFT_163970 [Helobdella robusta]|uniref:Nuclear receptor coactivator 6 TRADD-N domain-containing protein n=1 Tax=Helobdella robusta TaxID=6412 RepID=T1EUP5_HELRO|nr:hypothetical protein HELRODRAFT_163970 [Helobdella robusta]ESN94182.1 hypothetical protein HELRODRAFT_163970 [Helobdella robusta]